MNLRHQVREARSQSPGKSQSQQDDHHSCEDSSSLGPIEHNGIRYVTDEGHHSRAVMVLWKNVTVTLVTAGLCRDNSESYSRDATTHLRV
jgi:hypothetical protein